MDQLDTMRIFARVAELASFTQAADALGLPKASVSMAVQQIEARVGARLLHRTTRKVQLTQDGRAYYERCKDLLSDLDELQGLFQAESGGYSGTVRVDMSTGIARHIVVPRLPEFLKHHPNLQIELSSTDRRVDVVREAFDCVVRVGTVTDTTLIARPLGQFTLLNCASPEYLAVYGVPESPDDLVHHKLIHYASILGGKHEGFEYVDEVTGVVHEIPMAGAVTVNSSEAYVAASLAGMGIIQVPDLGVREWIRQGRLIDFLPNHRAVPMPVTLLYANRRNLSKRVRAFMGWMAGVIEARLTEPTTRE